MALPTTTISMSQVNTELGRSATASISLNESAVRTLAGVASGTISMDNLRGKSNAPTFEPDGGASSGSAVLLEDYTSGGLAATVTISCSVQAVWTFTRTGIYGTPTTGSSTALTRSFVLTNPTTSTRVAFWNVSATAGGVTKYWQVALENEGNA